MIAELMGGLEPRLLAAFAWLVTFAIHSTLLLGLAWALSRIVRTEGLRETIWKTAVVGGLLTATLQGLTGTPLHERWALQRGDPPVTDSRSPGLRSVSRAADDTREGLRSTAPPGTGHRPVGIEASPDPLRPAGRRMFAALPLPSTSRETALTPDGAFPSGLDASIEPVTSASLLPSGPLDDSGDHGAMGSAAAPVTADPSNPDARAGTLLRQRLVITAVLCWLAVGGILVGRLLLLRSRFQRSLAGRRSLRGTALHQRLVVLCRRTGVRANVHLSSTPNLTSPIALGRNEICVPHEVEDLPEEQQDSVLAHELAHLVRRDPTWLTFLSVLERAFFFQPLHRIARRRLQECAEYLCDAWAARHVGHGLTLARTLARVATWIEPHRPPPLATESSWAAEPPLAAGMAEPRSLLVRRIQRLLDHPTPRSVRPSPWSIPMSVSLLSVVFCIAPQVTATGEPEVAPAVPVAPPAVQDPLPPGPKLPEAPPPVLLLPQLVEDPVAAPVPVRPSPARLPPRVGPRAAPRALPAPRRAPGPATPLLRPAVADDPFAAPQPPGLPGAAPNTGDRTLGVRIEVVGEDMATQLNLDHECWLVEEVIDGSLAERMGVQKFDVITHINGRQCDTASLKEVLASDDAIRLRVIRRGRPVEISSARGPRVRRDRERGERESRERQRDDRYRQARELYRQALRNAQREQRARDDRPEGERRLPRRRDDAPERVNEVEKHQIAEFEREIARLTAELEAMAELMEAQFQEVGDEFEHEFEDLAREFEEFEHQAEFEALAEEFEALGEEMAHEFEDLAEEMAREFEDLENEFVDWEHQFEDMDVEFNEWAGELEDWAEQFDQFEQWQHEFPDNFQQFHEFEFSLPEEFDFQQFHEAFDGEFHEWDPAQWQEWAEQWEGWADQWENSFDHEFNEWEGQWEDQLNEWQDAFENDFARSMEELEGDLDQARSSEEWEAWAQEFEHSMHRWAEQLERNLRRSQRDDDEDDGHDRDHDVEGVDTVHAVRRPVLELNGPPALPVRATSVIPVLEVLENMEIRGGEVRLELSPRVEPAATPAATTPAPPAEPCKKNAPPARID